VEATLTGPGPWHVWGDASISILFWDITVSFDATFGRGISETLEPADIWAALGSAVGDANHWSGALPPNAARVMSMAPPAGEAAALLDPVGMITLQQRVAPLQRTNTKFRDLLPIGTRRFDFAQLKLTQAGVSPFRAHTFTDVSFVPDQFAPAQVEQLSDDQKLSRPSYETMVAGFALHDAVTIGNPVGRALLYGTVIRDTPWSAHLGADYVLPLAAQTAMAAIGPAAVGGMRNAGTEKYTTGQPPKVTLDEERYVVAAAATLHPRTDIAAPSTKSDAFAALGEYIALHPQDKGKLIVLPEAEAA